MNEIHKFFLTWIFSEPRDDGQDSRQIMMRVRVRDGSQRFQNHSSNQFSVKKKQTKEIKIRSNKIQKKWSTDVF